MKPVPNIVAVIPARYASTRLPAKPLVDLCGKPMIRRVVEQVRQCPLISRIVVATDDNRIAGAVASFGGEAIMTSPDLPTGSDRIANVALQLKDAEVIVNVQGDEPLIPSRMIDDALTDFLSDADARVGTVVKRIESAADLTNPNIVKVALAGSRAIYFSRSPIPHLRDGGAVDAWIGQSAFFKHFGLYIYRRDTLIEFATWPEGTLERTEKLEQLRFLEHGIPIRAAITRYDSVAVDTAADAERVRAILNAHETAGAR